MLLMMFFLKPSTDGVHIIYLQIGPIDIGEEN